MHLKIIKIKFYFIKINLICMSDTIFVYCETHKFSNRIKNEFVTSNFLIIFVFFFLLKCSVRSNRNSNMIHSGDEDGEFCSVAHKNNQKARVTKSNWFGSKFS